MISGMISGKVTCRGLRKTSRVKLRAIYCSEDGIQSVPNSILHILLPFLQSFKHGCDSHLPIAGKGRPQALCETLETLAGCNHAHDVGVRHATSKSPGKFTKFRGCVLYLLQR